MKYAIIKCINGNYFIHAEGIADVNAAKVQFFGLCQTLLNAQDVITAEVKIVDENLDCVEGYKEFIKHPVEVPEVIMEESEVTPETITESLEIEN